MRTLAFLGLSVFAVAQTPPPTCDRGCLQAFVDQYLDALPAHNAFGLPYASKVKFTENDQTLDLGDGLWNTATGLGSYRIYAVDPTSGQVGAIATVKENDSLAILALRLKIESNKIREVETVVNRTPADAAALDKLSGLDAVSLGGVPEARRSSREAMTKAVDAHFDASEKAPIAHVYPRRAAVVDEERQLVLGFFMFQQPGDSNSVPAFTEHAALLRIGSGKVEKSIDVPVPLPYGTPNPFFPDDWRKP